MIQCHWRFTLSVHASYHRARSSTTPAAGSGGARPFAPLPATWGASGRPDTAAKSGHNAHGLRRRQCPGPRAQAARPRHDHNLPSVLTHFDVVPLAIVYKVSVVHDIQIWS